MNNVEVGKRLKLARTVNGFTLEEVATKLNITKGSLSRYESGNRNTSIELINSLSILYKVQPEFLMSGALQLYGAGQSYIDFNTGGINYITEEEVTIAQKILEEKAKMHTMELLEELTPDKFNLLINLKVEHFQMLAHIFENSDELAESLECIVDMNSRKLDELAAVINEMSE